MSTPVDMSAQQISDSVARRIMKGIRALFGFFKKRDRILAGQLGPLPIHPQVVESLIKLRKMYANPYIAETFRDRVRASVNAVESVAQMYVDVPVLIEDVLNVTKRPSQTEVLDTGMLTEDILAVEEEMADDADDDRESG